MDDSFYMPEYRGSKQFSQQDIRTANATGFGAAADDYMERGIDLNEQLIMNKPATFFFRMRGDAMTDAGIHDGDVLIVDRSIPVQNGRIIIAAVEGELLVRRFEQTFNQRRLLPESKKHKPVTIDELSNYASWGVVTCVIHVTDSLLQAYMQNRKTKAYDRDR